MGRNMTEMKEGDMPIPRGGAFQARGIVSSKALRRCGWEIAKKLVCLECREQPREG